jgi:hypothetical protein
MMAGGMADGARHQTMPSTISHQVSAVSVR